MAAKKARGSTPTRKAPRCKTCGAVIRVPEGWSVGPAARRHYWAKHRDVMLPKAGR
jgi:hypothetical protein